MAAVYCFVLLSWHYHHHGALRVHTRYDAYDTSSHLGSALVLSTIEMYVAARQRRFLQVCCLDTVVMATEKTRKELRRPQIRQAPGLQSRQTVPNVLMYLMSRTITMLGHVISLTDTLIILYFGISGHIWNWSVNILEQYTTHEVVTCVYVDLILDRCVSGVHVHITNHLNCYKSAIGLL